MNDLPIFSQSEKLMIELSNLIDHPLYDDSPKITASYGFCAISIEHGESVRLLAKSGLITSAIVVHRSQFEALVRAVWILYSANDSQIEKLTADLNPEAEQNTKNLPQVNDMLAELAKNPVAAIPYQALSEFKDYSWRALNSYVHAGIHPLRRTTDGYPIEMVVQFLKISNGITVMAGMQVAILTGRQQLVRNVRDLHVPFADCLPAHKQA